MGTQSCCCGEHFENHGAHRSLEEEGLNLREGCSDREEVHGKEPQVLRPRGREGAAREEGDQQAHQAESFHHARNRSYFACGSLQGKESHLLEAASIRIAPMSSPPRLRLTSLAWTSPSTTIATSRVRRRRRSREIPCSRRRPARRSLAPTTWLTRRPWTLL